MRAWLLLFVLFAAPAMAQQRQSLITSSVTVSGEIKQELVLSVEDLHVLVAFERDGQPLRDGEGLIAPVSLADERPRTRHVKWLRRIEVRRVLE